MYTALKVCLVCVCVSLQEVDKRQAKDKADMERILHQTQANLMKNIPDLELTNQDKSKVSDTTYVRPDRVDAPLSPPPGLSNRPCHKSALKNQ